MVRTKYIKCQDCSQSVSTSCVICPCGGSLAKNKSSSSGSCSSSATKRRRTERTKRGKPDFYDALELEKQARKEKRLRPGKALPEKSRRIPTPPPTPHRMQLSVKKLPEEPQVQEDQLEEIVLSEEKVAKFSLILDEINRKITASSWKGYL